MNTSRYRHSLRVQRQNGRREYVSEFNTKEIKEFDPQAIANFIKHGDQDKSQRTLEYFNMLEKRPLVKSRMQQRLEAMAQRYRYMRQLKKERLEKEQLDYAKRQAFKNMQKQQKQKARIERRGVK